MYVGRYVLTLIYYCFLEWLANSHEPLSFPDRPIINQKTVCRWECSAYARGRDGGYHSQQPNQLSPPPSPKPRGFLFKILRRLHNGKISVCGVNDVRNPNLKQIPHFTHAYYATRIIFMNEPKTVYFVHYELSTLTASSPESRQCLHGRVSNLHAYLYIPAAQGYFGLVHT